MRNCRQVHAELPGGGRVRVAGAHLRANEPCHVEWTQAMALLVLGRLGIRIGRHVEDDDGQLGQSDPDRRAQPFGAKVDAVAAFAINGMYDEGLQDAAQLDVGGEFFEGGFGELGTRVVCVFAETCHGHHEWLTALRAGCVCVRRRCWRRGRLCLCE